VALHRREINCVVAAVIPLPVAMESVVRGFVPALGCDFNVTGCCVRIGHGIYGTWVRTDITRLLS
jgi:hypothetical protein